MYRVCNVLYVRQVGRATHAFHKTFSVIILCSICANLCHRFPNLCYFRKGVIQGQRWLGQLDVKLAEPPKHFIELFMPCSSAEFVLICATNIRFFAATLRELFKVKGGSANLTSSW